MAGPAVTRAGVDYADVQGIVRFGYRVLKESSYLLVRVRDAEAARAWLRSAPVSNATTQEPPPETAMQVAFTAAGLEAIGVSATVLAGFSREFLVGMTEDNRSRRLGDVGNNAPAVWDWGAGSRVPHLLVMFFAKPGALASFMQRVTGAAWEAAFDVVRALPTSNLGGVEPFGFADGISQPKLDWAQERNVSANLIDYSNIVALGEFLLGYRNEYDKYTDRPLLDGNAETEGLPAAEDAPGKKDLARNGTYLVMRQLRQDVRGFWQFVHKQAGGDPAAVETLASAMVGRTRAGAPLVPIQQRPIPGIGPDPDEVRLNQFTFDDDPLGAACPIASHVRRSNPRTTDFPGRPTGFRRLLSTLGLARREFGDDLISSVRFHRLLRRGREYGPGLSPSDALQPAPEQDPERGLHFISLNANISRQFEFLQNAWMMSTKFSGLTGESDPLLGHRQPLPGCPVADSFNIPAGGGVRRRVTGVPQFVTVRGGAYFFLPGLHALQYFARSGR